MSHDSHRPQLPLPDRKTKPRDYFAGQESLPVPTGTSSDDMARHSGAAALRSMAMRQALESCDCRELSELSPVLLASMAKSMWTTIKMLSADADRWRLMRRRACLLDRRMLDGPYMVHDAKESDTMETDEEEGSRERLVAEMDQVTSKWTVIPYSDDLAGPDEKKEDVFDSADFYVESGRMHRVQDSQLQTGQQRWEKEISAQLLLYRLCFLFQEAPMIDSGAWLFILRADNGAEVWFADRGNLHWFLAICPSAAAQADVVELLELLISDRCVIRFDHESGMEQPTAGETIGAAWSR